MKRSALTSFLTVSLATIRPIVIAATLSPLLLFLDLAATSLRAGEIHGAAAAGDLNKVRTLIEADPALLDSRDDGGATPLHSACLSSPPSFTRQVAVANLLLGKGANVNARNNYGFTPLHFASSGRSPDFALIQLLIAKGADVNAQLDRGLTSLHWVASSGDLKAAKLLIDHGADLNAYDKGCYGTVLQMAINSGPKEEMAKLLVESGAKLNQKSSFGNTELHLAALKGYADLARTLVRHGADVDAVNQYGRTPLYYAAKHGYRGAADALIAAGAKESAIVETNYGKAPQLAETLNEGEAHLWYLGGFYGGGYAVKTKKHLLLFDKTDIDESLEAGLANGRLNPKELAGQQITVLITKALALNHEPRAFELAKRMPGVDWVIDAKPAANGAGKADIPPHRLAAPHESFAVGGVQAHAIPAMGRGYGGAEGLGYLVEADGVKVLHAGFHASGDGTSQMKRYRKEIDFLKPFGPIDVAILSVSGHLAANYEPYLYLVDQLSPKAIYLMGGDAATEEYPKCVEVLRARNTPVAYPEGGMAKGERFHFLREQARAAQLPEPSASAGSTAGVAAENASPALDVTYLAHEGFLVRAAGKKVLIDALFAPEFAAKAGPPPEIRKAIVEGREPFNGIDLILVTHKDGDHFDPASVIACLRSNPKCRLVAHAQAVDLMRSIDGFAEVVSQIHEIKLEAGAREHVSENGIAFDALCLDHEHRPQTANLAFAVELGGVRFLHMGDSFFDFSEAQLKSYPFEQTRIDLLFLNQYDRSGRARNLIAERVKPSHIVGMHVHPDEFTDVQAESRLSHVSARLRTAYPGIILFEKPMERRVFTRASNTGSSESRSVEPTTANLSNAPVTAEGLKKGLVLHLTFDRDETGGQKVADASGQGNHGKASGVRWTANGKKGGAYEFKADGDQIEVTNHASLNP